jgi:transketolase
MAVSNAIGYDDLSVLLASLTGDEKHERAASSVLDVLWVLYDRVLRVDPDEPDEPDRDRFLLSKGHGPAAFYAVLAAKGFIPPEALAGFGGFESPLGYHPDRMLVPGVEISSGSLGHGLPIAVGSALALDAEGRPCPRVFCLVGDGELDEGSNFEAIQLAGRLGLGRLTAVVVDNGSATYGWPGGIERRFAVEGWSALTVPAADHDALALALREGSPTRPHAVVATAQR